jgi:hypothetical protein
MFGGVVSLSLSIVDDILSISYIVICLESKALVVFSFGVWSLFLVGKSLLELRNKLF